MRDFEEWPALALGWMLGMVLLVSSPVQKKNLSALGLSGDFSFSVANNIKGSRILKLWRDVLYCNECSEVVFTSQGTGVWKSPQASKLQHFLSSSVKHG